MYLRASPHPRVLFVAFLAFILSLTGAANAGAYQEQIQETAALLADQISEEDKATVAVVDFTDLQGNVTELGRFIAEEFSVALAGADKEFSVIDRTHLASILREHKLSSTGLIDPTTARELGKITGVQALITGTLTPFPDHVRVTTKVLDTETARLVESQAGEIPRTGPIDTLLGERIELPDTPRDSSAAKEQSDRESQPAAEPKTITARQFRFEIHSCNLSSESLTCRLTITNLGEDAELYFHGDTRMFDEWGTEHTLSRVQLAGQEGNPRFTRVTLIQGVKTSASLTFHGPQGVHLIVVMEVWARRDGDRFSFQLRDIPVGDAS